MRIYISQSTQEVTRIPKIQRIICVLFADDGYFVCTRREVKISFFFSFFFTKYVETFKNKVKIKVVRACASTLGLLDKLNVLETIDSRMWHVNISIAVVLEIVRIQKKKTVVWWNCREYSPLMRIAKAELTCLIFFVDQFSSILRGRLSEK